MAIRYVWSGSSTPTSPYLDTQEWDEAAHTLSEAIAVSSDGDTILGHYTHDNSQATNLTLTIPSVTIISVDKDDSNKYRAGAKERTNTAGVDLLVYGSSGKTSYIEGWTFSSARHLYIGNAANSDIRHTFRECTISASAITTTGYIYLNPWRASMTVNCFDCTFSNSTTSTVGFYLMSGGLFTFTDCAYSGWTSSTNTMFYVNNQLYPMNIRVYGSDLSMFDTLVNCASGFVGLFRYERCRLQNGYTTYSGTLGAAEQIVLEQCASDGAALTSPALGILSCPEASGVVSFDTSVYLSASDGENSYSIKMDGNSSASRRLPLRAPLRLCLWHDGSGSKDLTVHFGSDDASLTDEEVWVRVAYPDTAGSAYANPEIVSTYPGYLKGSAADTSTYLKSDSAASWTGSGPSTKYKFVVTGVNPTIAGPIDIDFFHAAGDQTIWVCPNVELT